MEGIEYDAEEDIEDPAVVCEDVTIEDEIIAEENNTNIEDEYFNNVIEEASPADNAEPE
jgi:hypothetical protein